MTIKDRTSHWCGVSTFLFSITCVYQMMRSRAVLWLGVFLCVFLCTGTHVIWSLSFR